MSSPLFPNTEQLSDTIINARAGSSLKQVKQIPEPARAYDPGNQLRIRRQIELNFQEVYADIADLENRPVILTAPNGTQYRLVVDNDGSLSVSDVLDSDADGAFSGDFSTDDFEVM